MATQLLVPDLGNFSDVEVIDVLVGVGDTVAIDTPLLTLETEKATMDVPATGAGVIEQLLVKKGSRVSAGTPIATLREAGAARGATDAPAVAAAPAPAPVVATAAKAPASPAAAPSAPAGNALPGNAAPAPGPASSGAAPVDEAGFARAHASPSVRKFARELGVDLARVTGGGAKGRVRIDDVKRFVKGVLETGEGAAPSTTAALPAIKVPDFAQFGPIEVKPLNRVQRISGPRLHASWVNLPHVTQFDEADITDLEALRTELKPQADAAGIKLTPLAFIIRACVKALQKHPLFNSSLDQGGENLVFKKYMHVGFAADTPNGLLVPVIRDADRKDIYETARALGQLAERARSGKLAGADMQGGTFTVSSLGGIGGTAFTPIINAPEVAILGVSRSSWKPMWRDGQFVPRLMLPLSLSYDHRVIDGANGARFTNTLAELLAQPRVLVEAIPRPAV